MSRFKNKIEKMSDQAFAEKYLKKCPNDVKVSEKRYLYKYVDKNNHDIYNIVFEYTIVKNPGIFSTEAEVATKTINDPAIFVNDSNEANTYLINAKRPSVKNPDFVNNDEVYFFDIYLKGFEQYNIEGYRKIHSDFSSYTVRTKSGSKLISDWSLNKVIDYLKSLVEPMSTNCVLIKTIDINDVVSITNEKLEEISKSLDKNKDGQRSIILAEIERTKQYLELLTKML